MPRMTDLEYIAYLEARIEKLEAENDRLNRESADYLDRLIRAQDLAAYRNMQLLSK
jgi:cell division protein FtsB